jgi:DNA-binding NarL/FixJ family response regulator
MADSNPTEHGEPEQHDGGEPVRIVVVDDHRIFREGLIALLGANPDTEVVGDAGAGDEALEVVASTDPDVVLMDIAMPGMSGIEATRNLPETTPMCTS